MNFVTCVRPDITFKSEYIKKFNEVIPFQSLEK